MLGCVNMHDSCVENKAPYADFLVLVYLDEVKVLFDY